VRGFGTALLACLLVLGCKDPETKPRRDGGPRRGAVLPGKPFNLGGRFGVLATLTSSRGARPGARGSEPAGELLLITDFTRAASTSP